MPWLADKRCAPVMQVRSTGPINTQTHQPIKGRKFGGGIRFGEMERDALLVRVPADCNLPIPAHPFPHPTDLTEF